MRKIDAARLFHAGEKVVDRRPFAVVTVEIEVARFAKADRAEKDGKHPNQFGALPVNGRSVQAYDPGVNVRSDGMGQRPGIRSEERRVGQKWVGSCWIRWARYHSRKKQY